MLSTIIFVCILQDHKQLWTGQHKQDNISYLFHFYCLSQYCQCKERSVGLEVKSFCFHVYNSLDPDSQCVCSRQGALQGAIILKLYTLALCKNFPLYGIMYLQVFYVGNAKMAQELVHY